VVRRTGFALLDGAAAAADTIPRDRCGRLAGQQSTNPTAAALADSTGLDLMARHWRHDSDQQRGEGHP
jgi:hypothetical protein